MKKALLILIFFTHYSYSQEYFEGIITFKTEISTSEFAKDSLQEILEYNYGKSSKMFYNKNGNFIRKYFDTGEYGNEIQIYYNDPGVLLLTKKGINEIDTLDVKKNPLKLIDKSIIKMNEVIMDYQCDCIIYTVLNKNKKAEIEYCYNSGMTKIDPKGLENHKDHFLSDYFKLSERPYLKYRLKTKEFELVFSAIRIIEKEVKESDIREE